VTSWSATVAISGNSLVCGEHSYQDNKDNKLWGDSIEIQQSYSSHVVRLVESQRSGSAAMDASPSFNTYLVIGVEENVVGIHF